MFIQHLARHCFYTKKLKYATSMYSGVIEDDGFQSEKGEMAFTMKTRCSSSQRQSAGTQR